MLTLAQRPRGRRAGTLPVPCKTLPCCPCHSLSLRFSRVPSGIKLQWQTKPASWVAIAQVRLCPLDVILTGLATQRYMKPDSGRRFKTLFLKGHSYVLSQDSVKGRKGKSLKLIPAERQMELKTKGRFPLNKLWKWYPSSHSSPWKLPVAKGYVWWVFSVVRASPELKSQGLVCVCPVSYCLLSVGYCFLSLIPTELQRDKGNSWIPSGVLSLLKQCKR